MYSQLQSLFRARTFTHFAQVYLRPSAVRAFFNQVAEICVYEQQKNNTTLPYVLHFSFLNTFKTAKKERVERKAERKLKPNCANYKK